jgi:SAM-dependent methyltransferase
LIDCADEYIGIDLNAECVSACQARFANSPNAIFFANDGKSLSAVADNSIDFAFSYDSLVHAEIDVLEAYLRELSKKLRPDGIVFIHHSNLGEVQQNGPRFFADSRAICPELASCGKGS